MSEPSTGWFKRFILPGLGVKAVVIGGGYATGRELAEFFLSNGPWGGIYAILFATLLFSIFCALTFVVARRFGSYDYRSFFRRLLGPAWPLFELSYLLFVVLILAVYGAAAGAIGNAVLGVPEWVGTMVLAAGIAGVVAFGNKAVERLFRDVSYYLYAIYGIFIVLALWRFGSQVPGGFRATSANRRLGAQRPHLFRLQHHRRGGDPAGPSALDQRPRRRRLGRDRRTADDAPGAALLHSDGGVLSRSSKRDPALRFPAPAHRPPAFHLLFQAMIFSALLESGTSSVHAINERINHAWQARRGRSLSHGARLTIALVLLVGCMFAASRFGLVALIANGYRALAYALLATYVLPLVTIGIWQLRHSSAPAPDRRENPDHPFEA